MAIQVRHKFLVCFVFTIRSHLLIITWERNNFLHTAQKQFSFSPSTIFFSFVSYIKNDHFGRARLFYFYRITLCCLIENSWQLFSTRSLRTLLLVFRRKFSEFNFLCPKSNPAQLSSADIAQEKILSQNAQTVHVQMIFIFGIMLSMNIGLTFIAHRPDLKIIFALKIIIAIAEIKATTASRFLVYFPCLRVFTKAKFQGRRQCLTSVKKK